MKHFVHYMISAPKKLMLVTSAAIMALSVIAAPLTALPVSAQATSGAVSIEGDIKVANVTKGDTTYSDSVNANVDEVVKVQVWYHNRENFDSGKVAQNLRVGINIPATADKSQTITGTVKGDNTNTVTETAGVNLSLDNARLEYIAGSAKWRYNKGAKDGRAECQTGAVAVPANDPNNCYITETISNDVATNSAGVVLENLQPCFAYESTVTVLMRVKASEVKVNKYVSSHDGDQDVKNNTWETKNAAVPGDKLDYMIRFENKGNTVLNKVIVGDNLPDYMSYVAGSTRIITGNHPNGVAAGTDNVTTGGINVGNLSVGSTGYVVFTVKIDERAKFAKCGIYTLKNVAVVRPEGMNEFYNIATTDVKVVCQPGETPKTPETPVETPKTPDTPAEKPEVPAEIPSTGPVAILGGLLGTSALSLGVHSYLRSRRTLRDAALKL